MSYQTTDYIKANLFLLVMERELLTKEAYLKKLSRHSSNIA
jgi:hypothetical protein